MKLGIGIGIPMTSSGMSLVQQLQNVGIGGLTFFKDYRPNVASLDADYSVGSATATYEAARSASAPSTWVRNNGDGTGTVMLLTDADVRRRTEGYFDETGFHVQSGEMIEAAGTNLLKDSYFADGTTTYWIANGTATVTNDNTYANRYGGRNCQKVVSGAQYDGVKTAVANRPFLTNAKKQTVSAIVQGTGTVRAYLKCVGGADQYGTVVTLAGNTSPILIQYSFTADATAEADVGVVANDDSTTFWVNIIQVEGGAYDQHYATSFIPTTTSALTRAAEVLKYATSGNINPATHTMFIKYSPESAFANDGVNRFLLDTNPDRLMLLKPQTETNITFYPNATDDTGTNINDTVTKSANTSYLTSAISYGATETTNMRLFLDGVSKSSGTTDYTQPELGTYFFLGSRYSGEYQLNGIIQSVCCYSRALSATEVAAVTAILNAGGL